MDPLVYDGTFLAGKHNGGFANSFNHGSYIYCYQSPVVLIDPNGKQVNSSILLDARMITKSVRGGRGVPSHKVTVQEGYKFTNATTHLLSLVSKVDKKNIASAKVEFSKLGVSGASLTTGSSSENAQITHYYEKDKSYGGTNGANFYDFMERNAHEVGHIPQLKDGNMAHITSSLKEYASNIVTGQNWHDGTYSTKEPEAQKGADEFNKFNSFIDSYYGGKEESNMLEKLYNNKNNAQKDIIGRVDQWWQKYQETKKIKIENTN